jgi:hypothetical protein
MMRRSTVSSPMLIFSMRPLPMASFRMASEPMAKAPMAKAPTAQAPMATAPAEAARSASLRLTISNDSEAGRLNSFSRGARTECYSFTEATVMVLSATVPSTVIFLPA